MRNDENMKRMFFYGTPCILKYFDRYIGNYEHKSLYYFIIKFGVSGHLSNGWLAVLCIRFAHLNLNPKPVSDSHNRIWLKTRGEDSV